MNQIDRFISYINPLAGLKRARARAATDAIRSYDAAQKGRRLKGWKAGSTSQNAESVYSIATLRDRARDLGRNNPYAKRAIEILSTNIVGTGIQPAPISSNKKAVKVAKDNWSLWANSTRADANGQTNFYGLLSVAVTAFCRDGEVLIRKVKRNNGTGFPALSLQVLECDYLDHNKNEDLRDGGKIIQGVEFNKRGERVRYWLFDNHPGEILGFKDVFSRPVPADDVIHLFESLRPGQVRGVPMGVSSFVRMRDLDLYNDAELVRQQVAACWVAFIQDSTENYTGTSKEYEGAERFEPGMIETLPNGKTITFGTPPKVDGHESYTRTILREIACSYGVTYEAMTGDYSNVNFSSARMGFIEFGRLVERLQELVIIPCALSTIWDWFNDACFVSGISRVRVAANWTCPRRQAVDPLKEVAALKEMVRAGFISYSEAVRQNGFEPDEVLNEIKSDVKIFDDNKFMFTTDPRNDPARSKIFPIPNAVNPNDAVPQDSADGFAKSQ